MPLHVFEDDELDILIEAVNAMQLCFHPRYAPDGHFLVHDLFELSNNIDDVLILADKNIISPICEIAITGSHKSKAQLQRTALFVLWTRFINARLSCGLSIAETDTAGVSNAPGETERQEFFLTVYETGDRKTASLRKREAPSGMIFSPTKNLP